jgi:hypothetical protein
VGADIHPAVVAEMVVSIRPHGTWQQRRRAVDGVKCR